MDMPSPCPACNEVVEFNDMVCHPNDRKQLVCEECRDRIEEENNCGSEKDAFGNELSWKADPDCGLLEIKVNGEGIVDWSYEDDPELDFGDFVKIWKAAQAAVKPVDA